MTTEAKTAHDAGIAAGLISFMAPWLLVAGASPLYTTRGLQLTAGLWLLLATGGVYTLGRPRLRGVGVSIIVGTLVGCCLFVLVIAALLNAADWD